MSRKVNRRQHIGFQSVWHIRIGTNLTADRGELDSSNLWWKFSCGRDRWISGNFYDQSFNHQDWSALHQIYLQRVDNGERTSARVQRYDRTREPWKSWTHWSQHIKRTIQKHSAFKFAVNLAISTESVYSCICLEGWLWNFAWVLPVLSLLGSVC